MMQQEKILIIDDDIELCQLMADYLANNGYQVAMHHHGEQVLDKIATCQPDLLVLDVMLPGNDGLTICKQVREHYSMPIIMLTALDDDIDEVTGLEVGADDYLSKPTKPRVLLAHIRAQLRRYSEQDKADATAISCFNQTVLIDASKRCVTVNGENAALSSSEFDLIWLLAQHLGEIVSRDELYQKLIRIPFDGIDRTIDLRVSRIRKKLGDNPKNPDIIKTVRNTGYLLTP